MTALPSLAARVTAAETALAEARDAYWAALAARGLAVVRDVFDEDAAGHLARLADTVAGQWCRELKAGATPLCGASGVMDAGAADVADCPACVARAEDDHD